MPFRKRDADAAMGVGMCSRTKRGENTRPPPRPAMVSTREMKKTDGSRRKGEIKGLYLRSRERQCDKPTKPFERSKKHSFIKTQNRGTVGGRQGESRVMVLRRGIDSGEGGVVVKNGKKLMV